jgi:hypothetical protein
MAKIAFSYRRNESDATGRIYDRLVQRYGDKSIFRDVDWVPFGVDFWKAVDEALGDADVLVAIVGPQWRGTKDDGSTRITEEMISCGSRLEARSSGVFRSFRFWLAAPLCRRWQSFPRAFVIFHIATRRPWIAVEILTPILNG